MAKFSISFPTGFIVSIDSEKIHDIRELLSDILKGIPVDPMQGTPGAPPSSPQQVSDGATVEEAAAPGPEGKESAPEELVHYCRQEAPTVDMRRVVVAAEGARLYWGLEGVSHRELGDIFDQVGWPRPSDIVQTMRNTARSKDKRFGWLERIRGRPHYYRVTDKGRDVVIGRGS